MNVFHSPVWKEHHQEQTLKGSISAVALGQQREGSHCVLGIMAGLAAFSWLKRSILQDASALKCSSAATRNPVMPHDFLVRNSRNGQFRNSGLASGI